MIGSELHPKVVGHEEQDIHPFIRNRGRVTGAKCCDQNNEAQHFLMASSAAHEQAAIVNAVQSLCDSNSVPSERMSAVSYAVEDITTVVKKCFPEAEVQCYGSMVTGMMGRSSDVSSTPTPRPRRGASSRRC